MRNRGKGVSGRVVSKGIRDVEEEIKIHDS